MSNPDGRPPNERRIASMLACFQAAMEMIYLPPDALAELYGGREFPLIDYGLSPKEEIKLVLRSSRGEPIPERLETLIDWHETHSLSLRPIPKMQAYRAAAAMFNAQLARDHAKGERLDEAPTTAGAIQRAIHRQTSSV